MLDLSSTHIFVHTDNSHYRHTTLHTHLQIALESNISRSGTNIVETVLFSCQTFSPRLRVVEQAADRVFMAARLFVRFFNQRGASLQQRILELLALADAADNFHKKTVTASVGGGVASVAGSITTITGLILAPFTAGTSLIVTAVGIGIATAGGVASASANITDTDCGPRGPDVDTPGLDRVFGTKYSHYAESISKKHLNQNVKHVMKEGGRAGKALVINTESLISTVQVLSVAGGAAKAAQVVSVTTGVMSGLFLALDVFFLAKDSMELKKGAKTEFAGKIREVCKDLQDGLLELNSQLSYVPY
uniref:Si:cabz01007802.1 n=1 Tax=Stegastes partitus TaxID=144197 RepID=A0A3B4Z4P2_9TELE